MQRLVKQTLAIKGGSPVRTKPFPAYRTIGEEERQAVNRVIDTGVLSKFLGCHHPDFHGGSEIQALEKEWAEYFGVAHAIAVNSATSGLFAAVGAAGIEPGDEVIVSPYTMSASAVAPLVYNAIPVFADIEPDYYCLSPASVEKRITERTRAIIVVDIFGQPYDAEAINAIARKHNLIVIEDCAQAPGARLKDRFAGALGNMGIFSLNYHKHIHTGEGGIIVTDDPVLADKLRLIRNHAEAVTGDWAEERPEIAGFTNMLGFNYRMTELEAAIAREQLKKLDSLLEERIDNVEYLNRELGSIPCIEATPVRPDAKHAFYVQALQFDSETAGVHRDVFIEAVKAELSPIEKRESEGIGLSVGYVRPLYLQPLYQKRMAYGSNGFPWTAEFYKGKVDYSRGICPVTEKMHFERLFYHEMIRPPMTRADLDDVVMAFAKVWERREELS